MPVDGEGAILRLATWNIRAGIGPGEPFPAAWWRHVRRERIEAIAAFVRDLDLDVAVLQEVALGAVDGTVLDQPAELARLTGLEPRYAALHHYTLIDPDGDRSAGAILWGNALLSRLPIVATTAHRLPIPADDDLVEPEGTLDPRSGRIATEAGVQYADAGMGPREPRVALGATVMASGEAIAIVGTHLAYVGRVQRRAQAVELARLAAGAQRVVVAGDLNAAIDDPELEPLRDALADPFRETGTAPGDPVRASCGDRPIDHVLVRGLRPTSCRVAREAGDLSDHWPVVADLAIG